MIKDDFFTMIMEDSSKNLGIRKKTTKSDSLCWKFGTEQEARNFIDYLKTDFARFCLAQYKVNGNNHRGELSLIPMLDFTQQWTDEMLYKRFGIDERTQKYITEFLPDYYNIR
jgi:hypothetical protein